MNVMWRLFLGFLLLSSMLSCTIEERIVIGAILPLTGDAAAYGMSAQRGIDLAVKEINQRDILYGTLVVVYDDSSCNSLKSERAAQNMITAHGMKIVIGDLCSASTVAVARIAEQNNVVLITPARLDGVFSITPADIDAADLSRGNAVFIELYKRVYDEEPDVFAAQSYDAVKIVAEALKTERTEIRIRNLLSNLTYDGVSGTIKFS